MKEKFKTAAALGCAALCALACVGCGSGNAQAYKLLGEPKESVSLTREQLNDHDFKNFVRNMDDFSSEFAAETVQANKAENFAVSPVSLYMALALSAECADGAARSQILNAINTSGDALCSHFPSLFNMLNVETKSSGKTVSTLRLTNSVWINDGVSAKDGCINRLSETYYAYSCAAPFSADNQAANKAVQSFVREQTKGLINADLQLSPQTVFTLINTLYLKDVWNLGGDDLRFSNEEYSYENGDGTVKQSKLLLGNYFAGRSLDFGDFTSFCTETLNGYRLKFILPNGQATARSVFSAENIRKVNRTDFSENAVDAERKIKYYTRCIFPEFTTSCDVDLKSVLQEKFGITEIFSPERGEFKNLIDEKAYCSQIRHLTKLKADKKGVEGAAVTVMPACGAAAPEYTNVYEDFVADKAFGFILTDANNVQLFAGIVNKI